MVIGGTQNAGEGWRWSEKRAGEMDCRRGICCFCGKVTKCSCCAPWSLMLVAVCRKWVVGVSNQWQCFLNLLIVFLCLKTTKPVWCNDRMRTQNNFYWFKKKSSFYLRVTKQVSCISEDNNGDRIIKKIGLFNFTVRQHAEARTCLGLTSVNLSDGKTKAPDFHCFYFSVLWTWGKKVQLP